MESWQRRNWRIPVSSVRPQSPPTKYLQQRARFEPRERERERKGEGEKKVRHPLKAATPLTQGGGRAERRAVFIFYF